MFVVRYSIVDSILRYGSEIWIFLHHVKDIEFDNGLSLLNRYFLYNNFYNTFCTFVLKTGKNSTMKALIGVLGHLPNLTIAYYNGKQNTKTHKIITTKRIVYRKCKLVITY